MGEINDFYENPYDEDEFLNPDCDCYGCATMRHACQYENRRQKTPHKMNLKTYFRHKDKNNGDKTRG